MGQSVDRVLQLFRRLLGSPAAAGTGDHELLDSFVKRRDESAFEELVRRHGPMVLGVCRRVLRDCHSADDAFQVTFLTLACKASSLRQGQALPAWLHRVAFHVALRLRSRGRRAEEVERRVSPMSRPDPSAEAAGQELSAVLDEELQRLPEMLRGPVVLCGLEGKTHEEAARELGWPAGSLSKRLSRGRELLRQRLARRGFTLGSAATTAGLIGEATAAVPEGLQRMTVHGALTVAAGQTAELSAAVAALLREVLGTMFWTRLQMGVVVLLLVLIAPAVGLTLFALGQPQSAAKPQAEAGVRQAEPPAPVEPPGTGKLVAVLGEKQFRFGTFMLGVLYSPDAKLLAVSEYNKVYLYDAATKKELRTWEGPAGIGIKSLAFSPDSTMLVTADQSPRLRFWDAATGKLLREWDTHLSGAQFVTFSPDGKLLATAGEDRDRTGPKAIDLFERGARDHSVRVRETSTGKELAAFAGGLPGGNCAAFSPNGQFLAWGDFNRKVHIRKITGGDDVFTYREEDREATQISAVAFSLDSKLLAVGNGKVIKLFDVAANIELKTLAHQPRDGEVAILDGFHLHFAPDGKTLGSICQGGVALWDVASGKLNRILGGYGATAGALTFHRDGKKLANTASDQSVRFWDLTTGQEDVEEGHLGPVQSVALSPDGKLVVTSSSGESVRFWDRATGKELRKLPKLPVGKLVFSSDGLLMLGSGADGIFHLYDPDTGKDKGTLGKDLAWGMCLAVSADGKLLAVGQQEILIVELPSGKEKVKLAGHGSYCSSVAFGPGNKTLVSSGQDTLMPRQLYGVKLWDLSTGRELRTLQKDSVHGVHRVAYSPDGRYVLSNLATYDFGPPPIKDLATAKFSAGSVLGEQSFNWPGNPKVFSPDGKLLAVGCELTQTRTKIWIDLYDTTTWEKVAVLEGHTQRILALAFSANGKFLVSGSTDTSARVWDVPERKK